VDIQTAVAKAWENQVSLCLKNASITPDNANKIAKKFVSALEKVNGKNPTAFPPIDYVKRRVSVLILELPSDAQQMFLEYEEKYRWYSKYAYNFMQVRIQPIEVKVRGKLPDMVLDWQYPDLMMVYTSISLPGLDQLTPAILKERFKSLVVKKSATFWLDMKHNSEITYMRKAFNVLFHKMFEKSGIDLTSQTAEQIREGVLENIKYSKKLDNFSAIDTVLIQMIAFCLPHILFCNLNIYEQ
jgi:hypothetical protein